MNFYSPAAFNPNTAIMDATLGITGYTIDTFETLPLISGLTITLEGVETWSGNLPGLYTVGPDFTTDNQWDGTRVVNNTKGNGAPVAANSAAVTTFSYAPGATSFGIGLGSFQSLASTFFPITDHTLFINGKSVGQLEKLAGANFTPGIVRNTYLRIDATGSDVIKSVSFQNNSQVLNAGNWDFLLFDRLAVKDVTASPEPGTGLVILLAAGALLVARKRG